MLQYRVVMSSIFANRLISDNYILTSLLKREQGGDFSEKGK